MKVSADVHGKHRWLSSRFPDIGNEQCRASPAPLTCLAVQEVEKTLPVHLVKTPVAREHQGLRQKSWARSL